MKTITNIKFTHHESHVECKIDFANGDSIGHAASPTGVVGVQHCCDYAIHFAKGAVQGLTPAQAAIGDD